MMLALALYGALTISVAIFGFAAGYYAEYH